MSSEKIEINVATDFSLHPYGRYPDDSDACGENFREKHLRPALDSGADVVVLLDGVAGYGSSFLEEAFGGLVRDGTLSPEDFSKRILAVSNDDETLVEEIEEYVKRAAGKE